MKKYLFAIFVLLFISYSLEAQRIDKAYEYLKKNETQKAEKIFNKALSKHTHIIPAKYGLTLILIKKRTPISYTRGYINLKDIKKRYSKLPPEIKADYKSKFGIFRSSIDSLTNWIIAKEYERTMKSQKISIFNYFIEVYKDTPQADKILRYRDSIAFSYTKQQNTLFAYRKFMNDYPKSYFYKKALSRRDSIWKKQYNTAFRSLEYTDIKSFLNLNKDYPFYNDSTNIYATWAIQAAKLQLHLGYLKANNKYYIRFIKSAAPFEMAFQTLLCLIQPDLDSNRVKAAIDTVKKYKPYFKKSPKIDKLLSILEQPKNKVIPKSISKNINTNAFEYMPVITADGKTLYFCSEDRDGSLGNEDIFVSYFKNNKWTKPVVVKELSTVQGNEAPLSVSADGNSLIFFKNGDIFISKKTKFGWSAEQAIRAINTKRFWEADAFLTADGNAIIFSSDRVGNVGSFHQFNHRFHGDYIGNLDLYVITKNKDGSWSKPINLGKTINTPYSERTPFLHPDMKTLYFSSDGHTGVGKMDVFKSTRLSDTSWTQWSEPVNLGLSINTPQKEYGYKISTDGTKAYYTKFFDGQSDIYYLTLPKKDRPEQVATISGSVTDENGKPLNAKIIWENLKTSEKLGELSSNPLTGKYFITLPLNKNYGIYVSKQGFYPISANINLLKQKTNIAIKKDFKLININNIINGSASIELNNVFFDYDKYSLKKESFPELKRLSKFIISHPNIKIEIAGHTDNKGTAEYNNKLSLQRAQAVKNYLILQGCNSKQLIAKGYGATKPKAENTSEKGRKMNRRVEFKVIK